VGSSAIAARPKLEQRTDLDALQALIEPKATSAQFYTTLADQIKSVVGPAFEVVAVVCAVRLVEELAEVVFVCQDR
jgi:hypothetical protein